MSAPFTTTLAERMATIARCQASGQWGRYVDRGWGRCSVIADGVHALISSGVNGWIVAIDGAPHFVAEDRDLEQAISMALEVA